MATALERSYVTKWLNEFIETEVQILVGDVVAPTGGGWQEDSSKIGAEFVPYVVVTPNTATPKDPSLDDPSQDWAVPYTVTVYGVDRNQVEDLADVVRVALLAVKKVALTMSQSNWRMTTIKCNSIGGVGYTSAVSPTAYSQSDSFTLTLSRSLA